MTVAATLCTTGLERVALVLNASRRFRYTLDLKKEEEKRQILRKIRAHAQVIRAACSCTQTGEKIKGMVTRHCIEAVGQMFLSEAWKDLTLITLMIAAVASLLLGIVTKGIKERWYDSGGIAFAVILVIVVTAISDYRQSLELQYLNEEKRKIQLQVIRGGRRIEVSIHDIVVGDVVPLNIGDQVPADGILIFGHSLSIDESSMTGESKIIYKVSTEPFLMSGCKVADGCGAMLVTSVGINTEWGLLMASILEDTGEETPLQVRLSGVTTFIGVVNLAVTFVYLVALLVRYFTGHSENPDGSRQFTAGQTKVADAINEAIKIIAVAVTVVVVVVPEGLPLAVTSTLAYSMRKMMADKALVRRLSACETMGSAETICSDKTGTLTLNQMTVVEAYAGGKKVDPPANKLELSPLVSSLLIEGIAQNTNGGVYVPEEGGEAEVSGSPTEKAILSWGIWLGMNFEVARSESSILHVFPFNSEKKRGGVAVKLPDSQVHVHWKGAAEIVLASCTQYMDDTNHVVPMDEDKVKFFRKAIEDMAARTLRCVAIAYRTCELQSVPTDEEELSHWALPEDNLILLAIVGIKGEIVVPLAMERERNQIAKRKLLLLPEKKARGACDPQSLNLPKIMMVLAFSSRTATSRHHRWCCRHRHSASPINEEREGKKKALERDREN
ncbi:hypothetical protein TIFTF001_024379 [Ficus carica]|uniref:Calcium-transporting ATPase n=1 Tax=Ficus carica TaxID=3494 RepID=A0AA88AN98_FICCA|nr:hypothetical protein TIFTF001_024379 [Ficus carica]